MDDASHSELIDRVPDYASLLRLDGRRFVVLGTGDGTGRQASHALHALGARLACLDVVPARAAKVAEEVDGISLVADATDRSSLTEAFARAEQELGGIDGVVDVVGRNRPQRDETPDEYWRWILGMNFMHAVHTIDIAGAAIERAGGGTMTFVASGLAFKGSADTPAYAVGKAGLVSVVRSAALRLGPSGIRVNAVAPNTVATPDQVRAWGDKATANLEARAAATPLRRINTTADIAAVLLFLSSPLSSNISGQTILVDGGSSVR